MTLNKYLKPVESMNLSLDLKVSQKDLGMSGQFTRLHAGKGTWWCLSSWKLLEEFLWYVNTFCFMMIHIVFELIRMYWEFIIENIDGFSVLFLIFITRPLFLIRLKYLVKIFAVPFCLFNMSKFKWYPSILVHWQLKDWTLKNYTHRINPIRRQ